MTSEVIAVIDQPIITRKEKIKKKPIIQYIFEEVSDMKTRNREKEVDLFLYRRNIEMRLFGPKVFIKLDERGKDFIDSVLQDGDFQKQNSSKSYIIEIWTNSRFKLEFINPKDWDHICLGIDLTTLTSGYQQFDQVIELLLSRIKHDNNCFTK